MKSLLIFITLVVITILLAGAIGAYAQAHPFEQNIVTIAYNWIVSLFV